MSLSVELKKIFAGQRARASEAGQAVIEYILVLVVTVSIILGLLYQFNDAFQKFLDNYFGDYIACLLETGELPSLGGSGPNSAECNAGFDDFSLAAGRPPTGGSGGSGSGDGEGDAGDGSDSSEAGSGSDSGGGGGGSSGGASRYNGANRGARNGEAGGLAALKNNKRPPRQRINTASLGDQQEGGYGSDDDGTGISRRRRIIRRRKRNRIPGRFITRAEKIKNKEKSVAVKKIKNQRNISSMKKAKFRIEAPEIKGGESNLEVQGITFGKFLKFLIILGILIAIFIFLGGQALQIKKSWQKGE